MATDGDLDPRIAVAGKFYLEMFHLYKTYSKFYVIGTDRMRTQWRVLSIDRLEPFELNIYEDSTTYSESECHELLQLIRAGNMPTGGLKFVTEFFGFVGFVKFLGPYYMLLIKERRKIGDVCGHEVYAVAKSEIIALPNCTVQARSNIENRYKKILCSVDLTKDFFFSYSYNIMNSLQRNVCNEDRGKVLYETMFVWNEFLTRKFRDQLKNNLWTVALVFGSFNQASFFVRGKKFKMTLIARRSRYYAGTRYLKRGVNEKGRVANDVETEQIVFEDALEGIPTRISSIVQNRGSIPLFWSQETSWTNFKPNILLKEQNYEATRLHFDNLVNRYGNPIIILSLIKEYEKKPRESKLHTEFVKVINFINKDLPEDERLIFFHQDINQLSLSFGKDNDALEVLREVAACALNLTGCFCCQVTPHCRQGGSNSTLVEDDVASICSCITEDDSSGHGTFGSGYGSREDVITVEESKFLEDGTEDTNRFREPPMLQKGVLRTNCIDCLDRTNAAQYAYGLAALEHQLHALGILDMPGICQGDPLAIFLMSFYERMGDTLALQYGGSAAHNKIFSKSRGQWKAAIQSQELFRSLQRHYSNTYLDAKKQDAINLFLGYFQPQLDKPALWHLDSDQHFDVRRDGYTSLAEKAWGFMKRSLSDSNMFGKQDGPACMRQSEDVMFSANPEPNITTCRSDLSSSRNRTMNSGKQTSALTKQLLRKFGSSTLSSSNVSEIEWLSGSEKSCEEEFDKRATSINSLVKRRSAKKCMASGIPNLIPSEDGLDLEIVDDEDNDGAQSSNCVGEYIDMFIYWVAHGGTLPLNSDENH